jgi:hypothetical protein
MANHHRGNTMHNNPLDALNWPVLGVSVLSWPWLGTLWSYAPTLTGLYMALSASFMLFQMCDKLGWLDRFKRRQKPN